MNTKPIEHKIFKDSEIHKSAELSPNPQKHSRNPYAGLTLMQYFKINHSNEGLEEIDEESNSSISAGTPYFEDSKDNRLLVSSIKMGRREKNRTQTYQQLLPLIKQTHDHVIAKVTTINFNQISILDKNHIKLPSIHQQRYINNSRADFLKDAKCTQKKQIEKAKNQQNSNQQNNATLNKQNQKMRIHQIQRNAHIMKKSIRARVTSTSFYQPQNKERQRERIRTQEQSFDKTLEKSFIVTKYIGSNVGTKKSKQQIHSKTLKKNQNTFKLLKNKV